MASIEDVYDAIAMRSLDSAPAASLDNTSTHTRTSADEIESSDQKPTSATVADATEDTSDSEHATSADHLAATTDTTHTSKETIVSKKCANCGAAASLRCIGCVEGLDCHGNILQTHYCTRGCQRKHWKSSHTAECNHTNARTALSEACNLLQPIFLETMRCMWKDKIVKVQGQGESGKEKLLVYTGNRRRLQVVPWHSG